ncbi:MAG: hypothetical protein ACLRRN_00485 [Oscillospiraceae bacterium]
MATLQQALTRIDAICPNAWDETAKLLWLNECESMIQTRILGTAPEQCITYGADTDRSTKLLVPAPFDRLYVYYVIAMCDYAAHETAHYTDSMMLFNAALDEYAKWYQRTNGATASTPGLVKEIAANTKARHTHKNLAVLDGITAGKMAAWNAKADKAAATQKSDGLMSAADKRKLDTVEAHAKDVDVDDTLSPVSTAAIMNKTVTAALNTKAGTAVATTSANGLMSAADKVKLDGVEDGATKTIVDDAMSDTSTNPVQNKVVMEYIDSRGTLPPVSVKNDTMLIQVVDGAYALRTKESVFPIDDALDTESKNAVENGIIARSLEILHEETQPATSNRAGLMSASDYIKLSNIESGATKTIVDAALDATSTNPVQNKTVKTALDGKASTAEATTGAAGLMSAADKAKLDGVEAGANKTTVDAALDAASENPVQNKAVKAALDGKLDKTGGTVTGNLKVTGALFSGDGLSFGTGENIHFTKAANDAGKLAHGAAGVDDTVPLARLKVASPTEDDDAATKAYVDGKAAGTGAVRYDAAQTLDEAQQFQARKNIGAIGNNSPQFQGFLSLTPANGTLGTGVGLSPSRDGNNFALDISDVNENTPTLLTGVKTPTDADTNAAATVEYVKAKVASGGVTDAVLYTAQTLTDTQKKQARANIDAASDFVVNGTLYSSGFVSLDKTFTQVQAAIQEGKQPVAKLPYGAVTALLPLVGVKENQFIFGTTATAGDQNGIATLLLSSNGEATFDASFSPVLDADGYLPQISMGAAPTSDMQIATKQYVDNSVASTPLTLTYASGQATGASYSDIRKAIESGRQIKLAVANTLDIIASNAKNETDKSVLKFINTDVGGDTLNIAQYTVTAQASGLTVNVKSREIA